MRLQGLIKNQAKLLLGTPRIAILYTALFSFSPYTSWIGMMIVALVTLRNGEREGGEMLFWAILAHSLYSLMSSSLGVVLVNSVIFFLPCYISACILRITSSWQAVAMGLFVQVMVTALVVQILAPDWVSAQYAMIQSILKASQPDHVLSKWLNDSAAVPDVVMANYAFGMQLMSAVISVLTSLTLARSLQSQLYYPGGFSQEMLSFRGNRVSFVVMMVLFVAAWQMNIVAMNVFPALAFLYMMAGLSLCANFLIGKASRWVLVILVLPLLFLPFVMLPLYVILGLLDSMFNLRLAFVVK